MHEEHEYGKREKQKHILKQQDDDEDNNKTMTTMTTTTTTTTTNRLRTFWQVTLSNMQLVPQSALK